ncbi:MAG: glycosyltransferase family 4 protein [Chloroflexi bacterium]|nr:glycosyltransferase family 4 protein [Chloroflexota bacterium]
MTLKSTVKQTITINGRFLTQPVTGVQRYALELFRALDRLLVNGAIDPQGIDLVCLVPPDCDKDPGWEKIEVHSVGRLTGNLWEQLDLPRFAQGTLLFAPANISSFFHPNQVVTIHDASVYAFPQAYSLPFRTKYRLSYLKAARSARMIITVSEFSKQELVRWCKAKPDRIEVIPHGSEQLMGVVPDASILQRAGFENEKYFLGVGSQSPHKNFHGLIEAFRRLDRGDIRLVLVGGKFDRVFQSSNNELPENTVHLGYVKDAELKALYQNAVGFVFPSFYEGFGLPVLEAMTAGCPVICSKTASLPEVGEDAVLYADPHDPDTITQKMIALLSSESLREILRNAGCAQAKKFSWETTARSTWNLLVKQCVS